MTSACHVRDTGTAVGRGVFAARDICAGELVERAPVVTIQCGWSELLPEIQRIAFGWRELVGDQTSDPAAWLPAFAVALGLGSLFNHANPANLRYRASDDRQHVEFVAAVDIPAGTQLTINYDGLRGNPMSEASYWFERNGVVPVDIIAPPAS